jgi:uncharacterized Zn-finger protein
LFHNVFVLGFVCYVWVWSLNWKGLDSGWFVKVVLVLWLVSAGFVVFLLLRVDWIVHHELYGFGLQFSLDWAVGYWAALRAIFVFLATPVVLSVFYFCLVFLGFVRRGRVKPVERKSVVEGRVVEQNHMLVSCPGCKRVFGKPLVMLDFSGGKTRLVNVCPYCGHVLGCADEKERGVDVGVLDFEERRVRERDK